MAYRTIQLGFLISGVTSASTGAPVAGGTAYFYSAGTTTPKYVYTEKEKTNGYYSYSLDAVGAATLYGDGEYKVVIKDSSDATVKTYDNMRLQYYVYAVDTVTSTPYAMTTDNDLLLVDTTSGAVTINALPAAQWTRPIKIIRTAGANGITLEPSGSETINGAANLTWNYSATVEVISDGSNLLTVNIQSAFTDADGDTKIQVEESADEDIIRFDTGGTERMTISSTATDVDALSIGGVVVTSTAAELNILDGVTATATEINTVADGTTAKNSHTHTLADGATDVTATYAELNTLDGITSTTAELNILDGVTSTTAELNILDGVTSTTAELNILDGVTATATEINNSSDGIGVTIPRQIVLTIGDWNMNTTASVDVAHGLTSTRIIGVRGIVRTDTDDYRYPIGLNPHDYSDDPVWVHIPTISSTTIKIVRASSSIFSSSTAYDSTSYNRGWLIVDYLN